MRAFGELESDIMRVLWSSAEPLSIQRLTDVLNEERPLAYTTVMTVTERLRTKGWLERTKRGRSYRYSPLRSADDYTAALMEQALASSTDRAHALLHFAGRLDADEAAALRKALDSLPPDPDPDPDTDH
ncbi:BlaI/MecI/CopY family transcriptional regulator [Streptomyces purpurogeneiscleroticus]|uniref:BlaI/MecI/CopY family transcriptional regulator n=1 Tax=Streptomyces purpurogeneiscleroticus TaxID=68259 RepID=UPI001CBCE516|nr:BlaI/MecI/CopY family transcriptional regulator [Streptomyces purpurogeneiscleroticus]MBZ4018783.1 CopY family transcriptional regulator [Streptomyces purpurogeneiscleroticus]